MTANVAASAPPLPHRGEGRVRGGRAAATQGRLTGNAPPRARAGASTNHRPARRLRLSGPGAPRAPLRGSALKPDSRSRAGPGEWAIGGGGVAAHESADFLPAAGPALSRARAGICRASVLLVPSHRRSRIALPRFREKCVSRGNGVRPCSTQVFANGYVI